MSIGSAAGPRPVPPGFVGVSLEYNTVSAYEGGGPAGGNPALAQLIRNLAPGQTPILRIGGDSTDWTWWPVPGLHPPPGVHNPLSPAWIKSARALALSTGARLILGINLEADSTTIAQAEATQLISGIGSRSIDALELGNEPELYPSEAWYRTAAGEKVFGRPRTYNLDDYSREFAAMAKVLPPVGLAGPAISDSWMPQIGQFLAMTHGVRLVTFHAYAVNRLTDAFRGRNCSTPVGQLAHPTVPALLAPIAAEGMLAGITPYIALVHRHNLPFRVDEMNAITCAGQPGVSDTFATALWAVETLFSMANAGVDGVNIHTWRGSAGRLFDFNLANGQWVGTVSPEYYGLLMFAQAAPAGSRLLPTAQTNGGQVQSWATVAPDHTVRLMLINESLGLASSVLVHAPAGAGGAGLERLQAPSAYATSGVTLAGQSFGAQTTTGTLPGSPQITALPSSRGEYSLTLPAASAALVTIRTRS